MREPPHAGSPGGPDLPPPRTSSNDPGATLPLFHRLAETLQAQIDGGRILPGERLPAQRDLAARMGVSRNTVVRAYQELERRGWARSRVGRGTFATRPVVETGPPAAWQPQFSVTINRITTPFLGEAPSHERAALSLAHGKVPADPGIIETFRRMLDLVLEREGARAFEPGPPQGLASLRTAIAAYLGFGGAKIRPDEVLITAGARQSLHVLASILLDPGDGVVIEGPSYRGAIQTLQSCGARILCVPVDRDGLDVEVLERLLVHTQVKLIYTIPTFQNPTGATLTLARRRRLVELAAGHGIPIIEDDPYWELRYEGGALPRLKALDAWGGVIHVGTFSKLVFPGVRIGWIAGPARVIEQAAVAKAAQGIHVGSLPQWAMARLLEEGLLEPHIAKACQRLRRKRDLFLRALDRYTRGRLLARRPEGGFFVWARLPEPLQATDLLKHAVARGVQFVPGPAFWPSGGDVSALRLCFAGLGEPQLDEAARILGESLLAVIPSGEIRVGEMERPGAHGPTEGGRPRRSAPRA